MKIMIPRKGASMSTSKRKILLLHDVRSTHNVGSIFRTADGAGVSHIYLSGHTPDPVDRFGRKRKDIAKVALGAEDSVGWEHVSDPIDFVKKLKSAKPVKSVKQGGVLVVALEQDERSVGFDDARLLADVRQSRGPLLLILGSEVGGVKKELLDLSDYIVEIPMMGKKESLNVSVAGGIAMYALFSMY